MTRLARMVRSLRCRFLGHRWERVSLAGQTRPIGLERCSRCRRLLFGPEFDSHPTLLSPWTEPEREFLEAVPAEYREAFASGLRPGARPPRATATAGQRPRSSGPSRPSATATSLTGSGSRGIVER